MLRRLATILLCTLTMPILSAQEPAAKSPPPEAVRLLREAQELTSRERYVDALAKLDEVEKLAPELPQIYNLRGTIYMSPQLRDFEQASAMFDKADSLQPGTEVVAFNKAEVAFVKHDWKSASESFQSMLDRFPKLPEGLRHMVLYKRLIAQAKMGDAATAEKTLKENFTFMDDTPAYYYAHAALAFQAGNEDKGKEWLGRAAEIFKKEESAPYMDSLAEARWVPDIRLPPLQEK